VDFIVFPAELFLQEIECLRVVVQEEKLQGIHGSVPIRVQILYRHKGALFLGEQKKQKRLDMPLKNRIIPRKTEVLCHLSSLTVCL
jgi:hypothetical protein